MTEPGGDQEHERNVEVVDQDASARVERLDDDQVVVRPLQGPSDRLTEKEGVAVPEESVEKRRETRGQRRVQHEVQRIVVAHGQLVFRYVEVDHPEGASRSSVVVEMVEAEVDRPDQHVHVVSGVGQNLGQSLGVQQM